MSTSILVVRIRGVRKLHPRVERTLALLRLHKPNHAVLVADTPVARGMLHVVKDYVTFGPLQEKTLASLLYKRGERGGKRLREVKKKAELEALAKKLMGAPTSEEFDPVFRLKPPRKGFKNTKRAYPRGSLGARPEMDSLLVRMA